MKNIITYSCSSSLSSSSSCSFSSSSSCSHSSSSSSSCSSSCSSSESSSSSCSTSSSSSCSRSSSLSCSPCSSSSSSGNFEYLLLAYFIFHKNPVHHPHPYLHQAPPVIPQAHQAATPPLHLVHTLQGYYK